MAKKIKEEKIECLVCGISVTKHNLKRHAKSKKHKANRKNTESLENMNGFDCLDVKPNPKKNSIKERAKTVPPEIKAIVDKQMKDAKSTKGRLKAAILKRYNEIKNWLNKFRAYPF